MRPSLFLFVLFTGSCIAPAGLLVFAIAPDKLTGWTPVLPK